MSGGGIRSNAFQLGLLSGLHKTDMLKNIDYISGVSGGSWAAGAYKIYQFKDARLFNDLNMAIEQPGSSTVTNPASKMLMNTYDLIISSLKHGFKLLSNKSLMGEIWRGMIIKNILLNRDVRLSALKTINSHRSVLIIGGTHDSNMLITEILLGKTRFRRNFPFEISGQYIGTIADCGNTDYCTSSYRNAFKHKKGIMLNAQKNRSRDMYLSQALAISSAVLPAFHIIRLLNLGILEWDFIFPESGKKLTSSREKYILSDGGHSDNTGALPLIERGADLIIISDASKDSNYIFQDFHTLCHHSQKLLKVFPVMNNMKDFQKNANLVGTGVYRAASIRGEIMGNLLYIKPKNNSEFMKYLSTGQYKYIYEYMKQHSHSFPMGRYTGKGLSGRIDQGILFTGKIYSHSKTNSPNKKLATHKKVDHIRSNNLIINEEFFKSFHSRK